MLRVPVSVVLGLVKLTPLAVKVAEKPWSQSWPMEIRLRLTKAGNTLDRRAPIDSWGKVRSAVCDARIDNLFGSPTRMPLDVEALFVNGVVGPRKWPVHPESTMARVLGTKVRGAVVFLIFSSYLVLSHSQLGFFLADPPFVSAFVAPLSCPALSFSQ